MKPVPGGAGGFRPDASGTGALRRPPRRRRPGCRIRMETPTIGVLEHAIA